MNGLEIRKLLKKFKFRISRYRIYLFIYLFIYPFIFFSQKEQIKNRLDWFRFSNLPI